MTIEPKQLSAGEEHQLLQDLASTVDPVMARSNPVDGAVVLAAMDSELEQLEKSFNEAKETQELLRQRKVT